MTATVPPTPSDRPISDPAGRVELPPGVTLTDSRFVNDDLLPVPLARRRWTTYNFTALWVGMAHNIPSWLLASGLVALGMDWKQAVFTIALANVIVLAPMLLTGHAGLKYGILFPVLARAAFGLRGAILSVMIRAGVACVWFGIQTLIGGQVILVLLGEFFGCWAEASWVCGLP